MTDSSGMGGPCGCCTALKRCDDFGSYARGDHGVGSDVDLVVVRESERPFHERALGWDATTLPVPADVVVYTTAEFEALEATATGFARRLRDETVWVTAPPLPARQVDRARRQ